MIWYTSSTDLFLCIVESTGLPVVVRLKTVHLALIVELLGSIAIVLPELCCVASE